MFMQPEARSDGAEHRPVAAFDFDGTITKSDTLRLFLVRIRSRRAIAFSFLRHAIPLVHSLRGGAARDRAKRLVCLDLLAGLSHESAERAAEDTAEVIRRSMIRPDTATRLHWHQAHGHRVIIVSASFAGYVKPVAAALDVHEVVATEWEVDSDSGRLTGGLDGQNVRGDAKVHLLADHLRKPCDLDYAYGNSAGDTAMLARARNPVRVRRRHMPELLDPPLH